MYVNELLQNKSFSGLLLLSYTLKYTGSGEKGSPGGKFSKPLPFVESVPLNVSLWI